MTGRLSATSLLILAACVLLSGGCGKRERTVEAALATALRPECSRREVEDALVSFSKGASRENLRAALGHHNLTAFILLWPDPAKPHQSECYAWQWHKKDMARLAEVLRKTGSAASLEDLEDLEWRTDADGVSGSFSIDMSYGLVASFLFRATDTDSGWEVTDMLLAPAPGETECGPYEVFSLRTD